MATGTYAPAIPQQYFDNSGNPLAAGTIETFIAGTSTHIATYSDVGLTVQQGNPLTLDGSGRPPGGAIFLSPGLSYKFLLKDSFGATIATPDNISAIPLSSQTLDVTGTFGETVTAGLAVYLSHGDGGKTAGLWYKADAANTYSSILYEVGLVPNGVTVGASGLIRQAGSLTGLTVIPGSSYYVGTAGAITATAPTNARLIGQADTATSIIVDTPTVANISVPQGGTGLTTLTAHGVLIGEGTSPVVTTTAGTAGQVLVSGGASADPAFAAATWAHLRSASGTDTTAGAADVDSIALTGLTALDTIRVVYLIESVTQQTQNVILRTATDSVSLGSLTNAGVIAAGVQVIGEFIIKPRQGSSVNLISRTAAMNSVPADLSTVTAATVTTLWTAPWTLALRHAGVVAGGTFKYVWNVYRMQGQ